MTWYDVYGWGWIACTVGLVLFWAVVIVGVILAVRYLGGQRDTAVSRPNSGTRPEDVLAQRWARGEIDDNEYRHRLALVQEAPEALRRL